ncbi:hypothetical protein BDW69DRAFT_29060 [Aspergillus filifer]
MSMVTLLQILAQDAAFQWTSISPRVGTTIYRRLAGVSGLLFSLMYPFYMVLIDQLVLRSRRLVDLAVHVYTCLQIGLFLFLPFFLSLFSLVCLFFRSRTVNVFRFFSLSYCFIFAHIRCSVVGWQAATT